jgi:hypothetical protein
MEIQKKTTHMPLIYPVALLGVKEQTLSVGKGNEQQLHMINF